MRSRSFGTTRPIGLPSPDMTITTDRPPNTSAAVPITSEENKRQRTRQSVFADSVCTAFCSAWHYDVWTASARSLDAAAGARSPARATSGALTPNTW